MGGGNKQGHTTEYLAYIAPMILHSGVDNYYFFIPGFIFILCHLFHLFFIFYFILILIFI